MAAAVASTTGPQYRRLPARLRARIEGQIENAIVAFIATAIGAVIAWQEDVPRLALYYLSLGTLTASFLFVGTVTLLFAQARVASAQAAAISREARTAPALVVGDAVWNHSFVGIPDGEPVGTVEVRVGVTTAATPNTVSMFYIEIAGRRFAVVEVRISDRNRGPYYLPPSGGFSKAGDHDFVTVPLKLSEDDAVSGWIGFLPWGAEQPTYGEARAADVRLIAVSANGEEVAAKVPGRPPYVPQG